MSPLKRREELRSLSEDHHNALVIALRCRRLAAGQHDADPVELWAGVLEFFRLAILPHFDLEETLLLPAIDAIGEPETSKMTERIRDEHRRLRAMIADPVPDDAGWTAIGTLLDEHIRFEERVVFEATQDRLPLEVLEEIARVSAEIAQICPTTFRPIPRGQ